MIQRIQSVWLVLCILCMLGTAYLPLGYYNKPNPSNTDKLLVPILANYNIIMTLSVALVVVVAAFALFLYKKRPLQKSICLLGVLFSICLICYSYYIVNSLGVQQAILSFGIGLPIACVLFFILAYFGIAKDDKLVRSLDRLR